MTLLPRPNGFREICGMFGEIDDYFSDGHFKEDLWIRDHIKIVELPFIMSFSDNPALHISKLRVNKAIAPTIEKLFLDILEKGMNSLITDCAGAYCYRNKRGNDRQYSVHSWGIAFDLNTKTNRMGTYGDISRELVALIKDHGFVWGGEWSMPYTDPMHFQYCQGY